MLNTLTKSNKGTRMRKKILLVMSVNNNIHYSINRKLGTNKIRLLINTGLSSFTELEGGFVKETWLACKLQLQVSTRT